MEDLIINIVMQELGRKALKETVDMAKIEALLQRMEGEYLTKLTVLKRLGGNESMLPALLWRSVNQKVLKNMASRDKMMPIACAAERGHVSVLRKLVTFYPNTEEIGDDVFNLT
jgi:hypothetical protein